MVVVLGMPNVSILRAVFHVFVTRVMLGMAFNVTVRTLRVLFPVAHNLTNMIVESRCQTYHCAVF